MEWAAEGWEWWEENVAVGVAVVVMVAVWVVVVVESKGEHPGNGQTSPVGFLRRKKRDNGERCRRP